MRPTGRLRWNMLPLMLVGAIVVYVDRNVLGAIEARRHHFHP